MTAYDTRALASLPALLTLSGRLAKVGTAFQGGATGLPQGEGGKDDR
jgi:hypothetical protein